MDDDQLEENDRMISDDRPVVVLHVGQTKAGSTAIQNYLDRQRDALLEKGFLFPAYGFIRANPYDIERTSGHLALVRKIAAKAAPKDEELAELRGRDKLILSAENLFLDCSDAELSALGAFFQHHRIIVVLVVRSINSWLVSRYVEDVMSGFKSTTETFVDFQERIVAAGSHDYGRRLDDITEILNAAEVRLVNYDSARTEEGIVPAFLEAAGLPVTEPHLARSIRSNIRERFDFLVEGKRRLNYLIRDLPSAAKLKVEKQLRDLVRSISREQSANEPPVLSVCLSQEACKEVMKSNRHLVTKYGLLPPLDDVRSGPPDEYHHRSLIDGADAFVRAGFRIISEQLCAENGGISSHGEQSLLAMSGITLVADILVNTKKSLHLNSPETALWAACYSGKLPLLLTSELAHSQLDYLNSIALPSDVVYTTKPDRLIRILQSQQPEAVIARPGVSTQNVLRFLELARDDAALVLVGYTAANVASFIEDTNLQISISNSGVYILSRPPHDLDCRNYLS